MRCEDAQRLLYRLVDDRLLDDDADRVRKHVQSCRPCADAMRRITALDVWMTDATDESPPATLRPRLIVAYRRRHIERRPAYRFAWMRQAASIALIMFLSGAFTWLAMHERSAPINRVPSAPSRLVAHGHFFPLVLTDSYTVMHADGRRERGARIHIVE
jgi:anti-sigma factor RsiW